MPNNAKVTRATYQCPKGEEGYVHYSVEKVAFNRVTGQKESRQSIVKTNPKLFESVKRNLELQGFTINVLFHPEGKYNIEVVEESQEEKLRKEIEAEVRAKIEAEYAEKAETESKKIGRPKKTE